MKFLIPVLIVLTVSANVYAQDAREESSVKGEFIISVGAH